MDSLLPTGFILGVLPIAWLMVQTLFLWVLFRLVPDQSRSRPVTANYPASEHDEPVSIYRLHANESV